MDLLALLNVLRSRALAPVPYYDIKKKKSLIVRVQAPEAVLFDSEND